MLCPTPRTADHFILENFCISAARNLGASHPLHPLISMPCKINAGIIETGIQTLLPNITGSFDHWLSISGWSVGQMLPVLLDGYNWEGAYLEADIEVRCGDPYRPQR